MKIAAILKENAERARRVLLNRDCPYRTAKKLIAYQFRKMPDVDPIQRVILRLTVIDSFYATNMSKRYYGIEDIAEALCTVSDNDETIGSKFRDFIASPNNDSRIAGLFSRKFGMTKTAEPAGRAPSLVSKYAYFLTEYCFPIYDSLAVKTYNTISSHVPQFRLSRIPIDDPMRFFEGICRLNAFFENFDLLDNLLWLMGKVHEGNLSLVLTRDQFLQLSKIAQLPMTYETIRSATVEKSKLHAIFGPDLSAFIAFATAYK